MEEWKEEVLLEYIEISNEDYSQKEWNLIKDIFNLKSNEAVLRITAGTTLEIFDYAKANSLTPQKAAMAIAENRIEQRKKENAK